MFAIRQMAILVAVLFLLTGAAAAGAQQGAVHDEFDFQVTDWNDCTGEEVDWDVAVRSVERANETPSGQGMVMGHWNWLGNVVGQSSGYEWSTRGIYQGVETYSLNNSLTGASILIENSVMHPLTPEAPKINFSAQIIFVYNADGDLVVQRVIYTYDCSN